MTSAAASPVARKPPKKLSAAQLPIARKPTAQKASPQRPPARWQSSLLDEIDRSSSESMDDADILSPPSQLYTPTKPPLASKGKTPASASGAHQQPVASKPASLGKGKQQGGVTSDSSDDDADVLSHKSSGSSSGSGSASSAASSSSGESDAESVGATANDAAHLHAPVAAQTQAEVNSPPMFGASSDSDATTRRRHASDGVPRESPSPRKLTYRDLQRDLSMSDRSSDLASPTPAHTTSLAPVDTNPPTLNPPRRYTSIEQVDIHRDTAQNGEVIAKLLQLRQRLARLTDGNALHAIVKAIVDSGRGSINRTTFDFDLCQLDLETVRCIQNHVMDVEQRTSTSTS